MSLPSLTQILRTPPPHSEAPSDTTAEDDALICGHCGHIDMHIHNEDTQEGMPTCGAVNPPHRMPGRSRVLSRVGRPAGTAILYPAPRIIVGEYEVDMYYMDNDYAQCVSMDGMVYTSTGHYFYHTLYTMLELKEHAEAVLSCDEVELRIYTALHPPPLDIQQYGDMSSPHSKLSLGMLRAMVAKLICDEGLMSRFMRDTEGHEGSELVYLPASPHCSTSELEHRVTTRALNKAARIVHAMYCE